MVRKGRGMARDTASGNLIGGVRPPWIMAPSAAYLTDQETRCGLVYDTKVPLSSTQLRRIYGSYAKYVQRLEVAKRTSIRQGYLLEEDAVRVQPVARPEDFE